MTHTIGEVARISGVTVRTLHHYDEIGLLTPNDRTKSGYPCSREMHAALGEMYVADPRFTAYWDQFEAGPAGYVSDACTANALRD